MQVSPINIFDWRNNYDEKYYQFYNDEQLPEQVKIGLNLIVLQFDTEFKEFLINRNYKNRLTSSQITTKEKEMAKGNFIFHYTMKYLYNKNNSGKFVEYSNSICKNISRHIHKYSNINCSFMINNVNIKLERPTFCINYGDGFLINKIANIMLNYIYKIIFGSYIKIRILIDCSVFSSTEIII
jgi:hypothetical protein